jgi:hypothetical protein
MKFKYCLIGLALWNLSTPIALAISDQEVRELVKLVDTRQRNVGDYASVVFIDQKTKDGATKAFEARVYRRDEDEKLMILFTKPKAAS